MYKPMLFLHWKQVRLALVPFTIAAFGLPILAVEGLGRTRGPAALRRADRGGPAVPEDEER